MDDVLRYVGPFEGVGIPVLDIEVARGEPFRVTDPEILASLLEQPDNYELAGDVDADELMLKTKGELFELADERKVEVPSSATKAEIIEALAEAEVEVVAALVDVDPDE